MKRLYYLCLVYLVVGTLHAADTITMADLPYFFDFEDQTEMSNWVLNRGAATANEWHVGAYDAYTGQYSMYVSCDSGKTNTYTGASNIVVAYRPIKLDAGEYDIAFDYKGEGNGNNGFLKIFLTNRPESQIKCLASFSEPTWYSSTVNCLNKIQKLNGATKWLHYQDKFTFPAAYDNKNMFLVLAWENNSSKVDYSSIMLDNLQIAKKPSNNSYPNNVYVSTNVLGASVAWLGSADSYDIRYRNKEDTVWYATSSTEAKVDLPGIQSGAYEFWISGTKGQDKSVYTVFPTVYVYPTDCFDMLNMYTATFETGTWKSGAAKRIQGRERVDDGPKSIVSRHTTHFDHNEVDPRTIVKNGKDTVACLKTVPEDEFGSIRLGNWDTGSEYESITFQYTVESDKNAVLLLRYAMVLENPNHSARSQPRFTLDILDENGVSIDTECASVDFHAPTTDEMKLPEIQKLWHTSTWVSETGAKCTVNWQDWKIIGISLEKYIGQTLTVVFTSYDCDQGGHFGYAYFTLNCTRSDVDGLPWGDGSTTQEFVAPKGFNYAWFNVNDTFYADTLSKDQKFYVHESDTNTYVCNATFPSNPNCGFSFDACAKPHNPIAEIQWEWLPNNCNNGYFIRNASHIGLTNQVTGVVEHRYDKKTDFSRWTLPDGTTTDSLLYDGMFIPVGDEGDTLTYSLWTAVEANDSLYQDSVTITIVIPAIGTIEQHHDRVICQGDSIEFPFGSGKMVTQMGTYTDSLVSDVTGCDSIIFLHLTVHEPIRVELYDTICEMGTYDFEGMTLVKGGTYHKTLTSDVTGCDSIRTLYLAQAPRPMVMLQDADICGDEPLVFHTMGSEFVDSFLVSVPGQQDFVFQARQPNLQLTIQPGVLKANRYQAYVVSYMSWCESYTDTIHFNISLSSNVVEAKFDDVLALLNEKYNGGYYFQSYQWYADGELIPGATHSYYYAPGLDYEVDYSVLVTLVDGTKLWVCPFTFQSQRPERFDQQDNMARIIPIGAPMQIQQPQQATAYWYDLTGKLIMKNHLTQQQTTTAAPKQNGYYILRVIGEQTSYTERIIVK